MSTHNRAQRKSALRVDCESEYFQDLTCNVGDKDPISALALPRCRTDRARAHAHRHHDDVSEEQLHAPIDAILFLHRFPNPRLGGPLSDRHGPGFLP